MKRKALLSILSILLIVCALAGCSSQIVDEHINDSIAVSGDLDYYAQMNDDKIKESCLEKHIEVTGQVSKKVSSTLIYIGEEQDERYYFSCTFSESIKDYDTLEIGDTITVHGVCTSFYDSINLLNMNGCQLVLEGALPIETTEATAPPITTTTEITTTATTEPTTEPTSATTTEPATEPTATSTTEPPHTHSFGAATCTTPKTCSCGATEGEANGHAWQAATCTDPKTCAVCGTTSGLTAGHNFSDGRCTTCGKDDPDYHHETMVWIPTKGGTKYHTHSGCSNMEDPEQVTQSEAESRGFTPCKRCH